MVDLGFIRVPSPRILAVVALVTTIKLLAKTKNGRLLAR
jgi:hypothetical protein